MNFNGIQPLSWHGRIVSTFSHNWNAAAVISSTNSFIYLLISDSVVCNFMIVHFILKKTKTLFTITFYFQYYKLLQKGKDSQYFFGASEYFQYSTIIDSTRNRYQLAHLKREFIYLMHFWIQLILKFWAHFV